MVRAAMAVMRPNWPPPRMAIRPPGRTMPEEARLGHSELRRSWFDWDKLLTQAAPDRGLPECARHARLRGDRRARRRSRPEFPRPAVRRWPLQPCRWLVFQPA